MEKLLHFSDYPRQRKFVSLSCSLRFWGFLDLVVGKTRGFDVKYEERDDSYLVERGSERA